MFGNQIKIKLKREFFERKTLVVARELLGKYLIHRIGTKIISGMITETEAYHGFRDLASHASRGRTKRTEIMFGPAGHAYIYLIHGMYYCLNVVTEREEYPAAVLIRGVEIDQKSNLKNKNFKSKIKIDGPGKLTRHFQIDKNLNGIDVTASRELWIEDRGLRIPSRSIKRTPRIGIDYAGPYKDKKWRFILKP